MGLALLDYNDVSYRPVATTLLVCAFHCGEDVAAFRILSDARVSGSLRKPDVLAARMWVQQRAAAGEFMPIIAEGKILEHEGKPLEALHLYQKGTDKHIAHLKGRSLASWMAEYHGEHGDVCKALARLRAKLGDHIGAEEAIKEAALLYDDPAAFYILAIEFTAPDSKEYETYLLKAASSDEPKAAHELGLLYFNQTRQGTSLWTPNTGKPISARKSKDHTLESLPVNPREQQLSPEDISNKRADALEWFSIGAESGITASQIYFAILLREADRAEEGLEWLCAAATSDNAADWAEAIEYLKKNWRLSDLDLALLDIDSLCKGGSARKVKGLARLAALNDMSLMADPTQYKKINGHWVWDQRQWEKMRARMHNSAM
ncbi:MAG: hypothetical protein Q9222_001899 [Ikaeria aurantiellina]